MRSSRSIFVSSSFRSAITVTAGSRYTGTPLICLPVKTPTHRTFAVEPALVWVSTAPPADAGMAIAVRTAARTEMDRRMAEPFSVEVAERCMGVWFMGRLQRLTMLVSVYAQGHPWNRFVLSILDSYTYQRVAPASKYPARFPCRRRDAEPPRRR